MCKIWSKLTITLKTSRRLNSRGAAIFLFNFEQNFRHFWFLSLLTLNKQMPTGPIATCFLSWIYSQIVLVSNLSLVSKWVVRLTSPSNWSSRKGPSFIPLYHSHPLTNIQAFIWGISHIFWSHRLHLADCYAMRFMTWSNYHLIDYVMVILKSVYSNSHRLSPLYYKWTD